MEHNVLPPGEIHAHYNWVVASQIAREALNVQPEDVLKWAFQEDDSTDWVLLSVAPAVWQKRDVSAALDVLLDGVAEDHGNVVDGATIREAINRLSTKADGVQAFALGIVASVGAPDGIAPLGGDGVIPSIYLPPGSGGSGDVVGPSASVDSELAIFSGTSGKLLKRATGSGFAKLVSGVLSLVSLVKGDVGLGNVDNTADSAKPVSTATQTALDLKAPLASPTFTGTVAGITKSMVGLGNVDNTTDAGKPVSTATQTALDLKAPLASPAFTGTVTGVSKAMVGLGNADDTSDANKPVSTAQAAADTAALNAAKTYADGLVVGLLDDRGNYDASGNTFPASGGSGAAGAILKGDLWTISVAGTLGSKAVALGDVVRALTDTPGQTSGNWAVSENNFGYVAENSASKDASGGYAGLTGYKLNLKNAAGAVVSWFVTAATSARTWTMPDKDGTVAMTSDITGTNSGTNTGDETAASVGTILTGATAKAALVDADTMPLNDSAASAALKKITWANIKATIWTAWGSLIAAGTSKATPVDGDGLALSDSANSNATKLLTWANLKATLKTYFDSVATTLTNKTLTNPTITNYVETLYAPAAGSAFTVDLTNGTLQMLTTNANCTVTLPAASNGKSFTLIVKYGGTHTITWTAGTGGLKWPAATAPTATSVNGKYDIFVFSCADSTTFGRSGGANF